MKIQLELAHKKAKVKNVVLKSDTIIGRSTDCGLRIASNEISRQHCEIRIGKDGVTVRDLGSSNGTFVNGYELESGTDYEIAPDSELSLGGIRFFVRFSEPAANVMQTDGFGSTVDFRPDEDADTADMHRETLREDVDAAEVGESKEQAAEKKSPVVDLDEDEDTVRMARPGESGAGADTDEEFAMSAHGDSAVLVREKPAQAAEESAPEKGESEEEIVDLELDDVEVEPEVAEEVVPAELDEPKPDAAEPKAESEATESEPPIAKVVNLKPAEREESAVPVETPEEVEPAKATSEPAPPQDEKEPASAGVDGEDDVEIPAPANQEIEDEDAASFLNQVSTEESADEATGNKEDESLGDFFKQFD